MNLTNDTKTQIRHQSCITHTLIDVQIFVHEFFCSLAHENETGLGISELGECRWF